MCLDTFCGVDGNAEDAGNHDKRANPLHCGKGWVVGSQAANVQDAQYNPNEERAPEDEAKRAFPVVSTFTQQVDAIAPESLKK